MNPRIYADALVSLATKNGVDERALIDRLVAHLRKSGRIKLLPRILVALRKRVAHEQRLAPRLEVARPGEAAKAQAEAQKFGINTKEVHVNESLIRGWRGMVNGRTVDHSAKQGLIELYQKIIKN